MILVKSNHIMRDISTFSCQSYQYKHFILHPNFCIYLDIYCYLFCDSKKHGSTKPLSDLICFASNARTVYMDLHKPLTYCFFENVSLLNKVFLLHLLFSLNVLYQNHL